MLVSSSTGLLCALRPRPGGLGTDTPWTPTSLAGAGSKSRDSQSVMGQSRQRRCLSVPEPLGLTLLQTVSLCFNDRKEKISRDFPTIKGKHLITEFTAIASAGSFTLLLAGDHRRAKRQDEEESPGRKPCRTYSPEAGGIPPGAETGEARRRAVTPTPTPPPPPVQAGPGHQVQDELALHGPHACCQVRSAQARPPPGQAESPESHMYPVGLGSSSSCSPWGFPGCGHGTLGQEVGQAWQRCLLCT